MNYTVDADTLQQLLNYLAGRPYVEVHALVKALQENAKPQETAQAALTGSEQTEAAS